ncbi:hypothetical protein F383_26341 [Gossypium arboreum]|uniref:Uncharacterized protein n=1 Tax=Gossypium arboreum TaxID=29729 RepID=A0A0B0P2S6_GOSAR|nr:hypothetical protein F383_26341 [Gossypium arboreum]
MNTVVEIYRRLESDLKLAKTHQTLEDHKAIARNFPRSQFEVVQVKKEITARVIVASRYFVQVIAV